MGAEGVWGRSLVGLPARPAASAHPGDTEVALIDADAARAGDAAAVDAGDTWPALMHRAAGHLARGVVGLAGRGYGLRVAIVVGKGNNGGDGWAAARRLEAEHGAQCWVVAVDGVEVAASSEAAANRAAWIASGGRTGDGTAALPAALAWCDVAVDCLLGTGVSGAPRGAAGEGARALLTAADAGVPVVACDIPSGVSADDGSAPDGAVRADLTVTFGAVKRGLLLHPGRVHAGRLTLGELGGRYTPPPSRWAALTPLGAAPPRYAADADKRARGVVLALAGARGTSGAAVLTATGALRAGAGLVTLATPEAVRPEVAAAGDPAVMVHGLPAGTYGALADPAASPDPAQRTGLAGPPDLAGRRDLAGCRDLAGRRDLAGPHDLAGPTGLADLAAGTDVVVAGPGLGYGPGAAAAVAWLRRHAPRLVLDADALNVHRDDPDTLADHAGVLVLTPHERELARIGGGSDGPEAWANRVERVPRLAAAYDATIVAKGPATLVAAPDGRVWVTPVGGPAAGSGGTGDVLAGVIAAAVAVADDPPLAVAQAVWWHAAAAELAGADRAGRAGAGDLLAALPVVLGRLPRPPHAGGDPA